GRMSIVVASARAYESLLGIDIRRVPQISGGRRRRHRMVAIEAPGMIGGGLMATQCADRSSNAWYGSFESHKPVRVESPVFESYLTPLLFLLSTDSGTMPILRPAPPSSCAKFDLIVAAPAAIDPDVAADGPAKLLKALLERRETSLSFRIVRTGAHEHANASHRLALLRARRERPLRRAAKCSKKFPPSDGDCHTPLPCEVRRERYHATSVQSSRSRRQDAGCFHLSLRL